MGLLRRRRSRGVFPAIVTVLLVLAVAPGLAETVQESELAKWECTGVPCPWGPTLSNHALVWPADSKPLNRRLGYSVSAGIYLPAAAASRIVLTLDDGTATVYAGAPDSSSHRVLREMKAGDSVSLNEMHRGEVVSVQSPDRFSIKISETPPPKESQEQFTNTAARTEPSVGASATEPPAASFTDVLAKGNAIDPRRPAASVVPAAKSSTSQPLRKDETPGLHALWRCNAPNCSKPDWVGAVLAWPSWAAYDTNGRAGTYSRSVYNPDGESLYPYMGRWANGCKVKALSGKTLIIEWKRGSESWRETLLEPGDSHTIRLERDEDGAMIESQDGVTEFSVALSNCTPQQIEK
jgi:hypothetical protein